MKQCVIFCAGEFAGLSEPIAPGSLVIAADGGWQHVQALGLEPDVVLGDFDSLGYVPVGAECHPVEKDDTDCMLAIKKGLELGCDTFYIYGSLDGPRLDHTVANFQALHYLVSRGCRGYLIGNSQIATAISGQHLTFPRESRGYISLFCLGADAKGVTIRGLQYEMENGTLRADFPLGVSNRFVEKEATVFVEDGTLLLIWQRENGMC